MPTQNPSNLYMGDAVVLDSRPSVNLALQLMAKQQAKKDALDKYYSKLIDDTTGNEDKMRPIDIEQGWGKKLNDWQMFYMNPENKKNILNPNRDGYKTVNRLNAMHQDLIADARKSKDFLSQEMKVAALNNSGHWNPTDADKDEAHQLSKSIYDNSRMITEGDEVSGLPITREPSINKLSTNYPAFDANKQSQFSKNVIGEIKPKYDESKARFDSKSGEIFLPKNYSQEDIKKIADNVGKINTRSSAGIFYEGQLHELAKNPAALDQATKVYQSVYGRVDKDGNPNLVDTPQKVAQADYIVKAMQAGGEEKITDGLLKQRLSQKFAKEQQARAIAAANTRQQRSFDFRDSKGAVKNSEEFAQALTNVVKEGDADKIQTLFHQLNGGNGKYNDVEYRNKNFLGVPIPPEVTVFTNEKQYDPALKRYVDVVQPTVFKVDDNLIDNMRGVIVHTVGKTAANTKKVLSTGNTKPATTNKWEKYKAK